MSESRKDLPQGHRNGRADRPDVAELLLAFHGVFTTQEANSAGLSQAALDWAVAKGVLRRLRRGAYMSAAGWEGASRESKHLLEIYAQQRSNPGRVACAGSAAIVWRLPTPHGPPAKPILTTPRAGPVNRPTGRRAGALGRRSWLTEREVRTTRDGLLVTSALRTVLDCARLMEPGWGLAVADAALGRGLVTPEALRAYCREPGREQVPGMRRAKWVADHVRPDVESPLESLGRATIVLADLPEPTPQVWVSTRAGSFRVDLLDEKNRVITEADGRVKYATAEDLWQEKRREDALRDAGFEVVRFTMTDHKYPQSWLASYRRALARANGTSRP